MNYLKEVFSTFIEKFCELSQIPANFLEVLKSPSTVLAILGCIIIFVVLFKTRKIKLNSKMITRIGLALALTCILSMIKLYRFPQGGSITPGRFLPLFIIAFMYGPEIGLFTGLLYGILDFLLGPYIVSPIQVLFDYPLAFMMLGLAGFFPNKKALGVIAGTLGRMVCGVISGVVFFGEYAPEGTNTFIYSLSVNAPVIGIEGIICLILITIIPVDTLIKQLNKD